MSYTPTEIRRAFRIIDWFLNLPPELERKLTHRVIEFEKENTVPYVWSVERMAREDGISIGREEGREEGRLEGREEGREEGRLEGESKLRKFVSSALSARFGDEGRRFVETELASADDVLLEKVNSTFFRYETLDELRTALNRPTER